VRKINLFQNLAPLVLFPTWGLLTKNFLFLRGFRCSSGAKLRIVNSAIAMGSRIMSARSEIWDETTKRLCVTGVHIKMEPSLPKLKQKL